MQVSLPRWKGMVRRGMVPPGVVPLIVWMALVSTFLGDDGAAPKPAAASGANPANYVLGPDDEIVIHALHVEEITEAPVRVDSTGYIKAPLIGRVRAGGQTVDQLEQALSARLSEYVINPEVTVRIAEFRSQPVSVLGAVKNPGVYFIRGPKR